MDSILVIAANALREVRHRRLVWVVLGAGVLVAVGSFTPLFFHRLATTAGETKLAERIAAEAIAGITGAMGGLATLLGLFLGATAISSEVKSKTIVTVLARPIERWHFVVGRWLGVQAFALLVFVVGWAGAVGIGWYLGAVPGLAFWLSEVERLVGALFFAGVAVGLATVLPPGLAGLIALALDSIPRMAQSFVASPIPVVRMLAWTAYLVGSASMPTDLIGTATHEVLNPRYGLFAAVLLENVLYAATVLMLGCVVFSRREIRLG